MKNRLLVFCALALVVITTITAYNSHTGPARQRDGVMMMTPREKDSLMHRGKEILDALKLDEADVHALSTYLDNR